MKKQVTIPIFIPHQGCPHTCAFCNQHQVSSTYTPPTKKSIEETIELYLATVKPETRVEAAFFGGSFTAIEKERQEYYLSSVEPYLKSKKISGIRLSTRPDYIDEPVISLLKEYGVTVVELGAQSLNHRVLDASDRGHGAHHVVDSTALLKKHSLDVIIQLMVGLPGDTREGCRASAQEAVSLSPQGVRLYPVVVLKDTGLAAMAQKKSFTPLSIDDAVEWTADMYEIFSRAGIPVIRTGLHPMTPHEEENIIAGPYHTAFGYLVKSRIKQRLLLAMAEEGREAGGDLVRLVIPRENREEWIGHRRENITFIEKRMSPTPVEWIFR
jgi:histone acetyltransferase (RNA polymerase elongator complex component)